jgi:hypothetical protein
VSSHPSPEEACRRLVVEFAHLLDHRRFEETAALFAEDAVWDRHGESLVGPSAILGVLRERPSTQVERHVMTTTLVDRVTDTECTAVSYVLIYRASEGSPTPLPLVGEFHDRFVLTAQGWRFAYRTSVAAFASAGARA